MSTLPEFLYRKKSVSGHPSKLTDTFHGYQPLLASWLLDFAITLGLYKVSGFKSIIDDEDFARVTGLEIDREFGADDLIVKLLVNGEKVTYSDSACKVVLQKKLAAFRKLPVVDELYIFENIGTISKLIGLSHADQAVLCFAVMLEVFTAFRGAISAANVKVSDSKLGGIIAHLTGHGDAEIIASLRKDAKLTTAGILQTTTQSDFAYRIDLLNGLGTFLSQRYENDDALLNRFLQKTSPACLQLHNFPHLSQDITALTTFLRNSLTTKSEGTNILLYGIPGTGKTELVKAVACELKAELFEIFYSDSDGNPITGNTRLRAYNLCQLILANRDNAILMFDEIEDVLPRRRGFRGLIGVEMSEQGSSGGKAWINRALERNATPAIWITNDANLDEAYLRRFDYSIRFSVPPQKVRMEIARHHLGQFNPTEEWLAQIASNEQTTPAQYERAAKVAKVSSGDDDYARQLVLQVLDRSATLLGQKRLAMRSAQHTGYDLRFANTSLPMPDIISGLKKRCCGTFCFYGPAGTGKSELARHIADELGKPIILRRASDILSKWLGESEHNIANMFAEARQQDAVLILDEADSFLADRRDAQQSWEVTQVNELLTQMEAFDGIFICTTNLMERLDPASLRRFAFKVNFDYLNPEQRWAMFNQELLRLGGKLSDSREVKNEVCGLSNLTPGDFAVAARQFVILDRPVSAEELCRQLSAECRLKDGSARTIGFIP